MWRDVSPGGALGDFVAVFRAAGRNRWRYAFLAALPPLGIFTVFANEEERGLPPPPKITYITSWRADRSEAEIVKSNIANQKYQDWQRAELARREAEVREVYKTIGRYSGMDVDAIDKQGQAERAAEDARKVGEDAHMRRQQAPVAPR